MSSTVISLLISAAGVLVSVIVSTFVAGMNTGAVKTDIAYMKRDLQEIRQLFVLSIPASGQARERS